MPTDKHVQKPTCKLVGKDGNVFAVIGEVRKVLKQAGRHEQAAELVKAAFRAKSYEKVLALCFRYVNVE